MEDNNKEKDIVDKSIEKGVNFVGDKAKKSLWQLIKPYLPAILSAIGTFFLILIAIGLLLLVFFAVQLAFGKFLGIFSPDASDEDTSVNIGTEDIVYINDEEGGHGEYKLTVENLAEKIRERLEEQKVDDEAMGFLTESLEDMMDKYIKAAVQTTYPKTEVAENELDGIITVYRLSAEGTKTRLKYMKYSEFKNYNGLDRFSINPETFKLCINRAGNSTTYTYADGSTKTESSTRNC